MGIIGNTIYRSEIMGIYFRACDIYYRTEYFQFNIKCNTIHDKREFFYETLKELDCDVRDYYEKTNLKSKYYYFLPFIKKHIYDYVQNCLSFNYQYAYDPVWQKGLFNGLMRKYFDILGFINSYKYENPNWDFEEEASNLFNSNLIE